MTPARVHVATGCNLAPHVVTNRLRAANWIYANLFANDLETNTTLAHQVKLRLTRFVADNQMEFARTIPENDATLSHAGALTFGSCCDNSGQRTAGICPASAVVNCSASDIFKRQQPAAAPAQTPSAPSRTAGPAPTGSSSTSQNKYQPKASAAPSWPSS